MRMLWGFVVGIIAAIVVIAMGIWVAENSFGMSWHYFGNTFIVNAGWIAGASFILGFLLAALLALPAWIASGVRGWSLGRQNARATSELDQLRAERERLGVEHERLIGEHRQVLAERDQMRTRLASAQRATPAAAAPVTSAPAAMAPRTGMERAELARPGAVAPTTGMADNRMAAGTAASPADTITPAATARPTLGERLRGMFGPQEELPPDQTGYPEGPTAPTA